MLPLTYLHINKTCQSLSSWEGGPGLGRRYALHLGHQPPHSTTTVALCPFSLHNAKRVLSGISLCPQIGFPLTWLGSSVLTQPHWGKLICSLLCHVEWETARLFHLHPSSSILIYSECDWVPEVFKQMVWWSEAIQIASHTKCVSWKTPPHPNVLQFSRLKVQSPHFA